MKFIYILLGTLFTVTLLAQMLAYVAFTMKKRVDVRTSRNNRAR